MFLIFRKSAIGQHSGSIFLENAGNFRKAYNYINLGICYKCLYSQWYA